MQTRIHAVVRPALIVVAIWFASFGNQLWAMANPANTKNALVNLERYLSQFPAGSTWRDYLELEALHAEADAPPHASRPALLTTLRKLHSGAAGLELAPFVNFRRSLLSELSNAELVEFLQNFQGAFRAVNPEELHAARSELIQAVQQLDNYLTPGGANGQKWKKFFHWDDLQKQLAAGDQADPEMLYFLSTLFIEGHEGLELPVMQNTRKAIIRYMDLLETAQNVQANIQFPQEVQKLGATLAEFNQQPNHKNRTAVGLQVGRLAAAGQIPEILHTVRSRFSRPNLWVRVSERLVGSGINNHISQVDPLTDNILGTSIRGTTNTQAWLVASLRDNPNYALIDLHLSGNVYSKTVGVNGPAVIHSNGVTRIDAHKLMGIYPQGITAGSATAWADTDTTFTGIGSNRKHFNGLITKVATKRAYESKPQAEAIASQHAQQRLQNRMEAQAGPLIAQADRDLKRRVKTPLIRWGLTPQDLAISSSADHLYMRSLTAASFQMAANDQPPAIAATPLPAEMVVNVHESLVNNAAATVFGGRTMTKDDLETMLVRLTGKTPAEFSQGSPSPMLDPDNPDKEDLENKDYAIAFSSENPIYVEFADGGFKVTIAADRFISRPKVKPASGPTPADAANAAGEEEKEYPGAYISANYKLETNGRGIRAVRQGDIEITFDQMIDTELRVLRRRLAARFGEIFKPTLEGEGLQLPGNYAKMGKLYVQSFISDQGWLQLGWRN
ncbi:MAG: hypothetical protein SFX18_13030 [Pirellulales bacterium]|nr:hypothetical protein [Pirellulales bacterium]